MIQNLNLKVQTYDFQVIDLHDYISRDWYEVLVPADTICMILPRHGKKEQIYDALHGVHEHMGVYYKEDVPERWHYKNNPRVLPIVIVMDIGYQCVEVSPILCSLHNKELVL